MPKKKIESADKRNPVVSAVLNFIIWGTGYIYNGKRIVLGILLLFSFLVLAVAAFFVGIRWFFAMPGLLFCIAHFLISIGIAIDGYMECK